MIEFGAIKIAIGKCAVNKGNTNKITNGKITIDKLTGFKFFELHFFFTIFGVLVSAIKEIGCHKNEGIYILTGLYFQQSSALKKQKIQKQFQASLIIF